MTEKEYIFGVCDEMMDIIFLSKDYDIAKKEFKKLCEITYDKKMDRCYYLVRVRLNYYAKIQHRSPNFVDTEFKDELISGHYDKWKKKFKFIYHYADTYYSDDWYKLDPNRFKLILSNSDIQKLKNEIKNLKSDLYGFEKKI